MMARDLSLPQTEVVRSEERRTSLSLTGRIEMKNLLLCIFFLILSSGISDAAILSHQMDIEIDPHRHLINAMDTMRFERGSDKKRFFLNRDIRIISLKSGDTPLEYSKSIEGEYQEIIVDSSGLTEVTIAYEGIIYDEVKKAGGLTFVKGDRTKGIISEGGVFLAPETGWYPDDEGLSIFHIKVKIKGGLRTVTQGEVVRREYHNDTEYSEWKGSVPVDGLFLIASKFVIDEVNDGKVRYFTYLSKENAHLSKIFIEGSRRYIEFYSRILGDYPYRDWSVVENFFSSGYGMPGFTLLDPLVIRQGERILRPGYIDHEIVHSWFGNYVYPDYKKGNWVEAITTYLSNYYYKEVFSGEDEAKRHRISTVERFSIRVTPERDYPLRNFISKEEDYDNDIGYGKGSMVFHSLRRLIGDRAFFSSIKTIVSRYGGKRASWEDLRRVFEEIHGSDLSFFFEQWLDRKGGPVISLSEVMLEAREKGFLIKGKVLQDGVPYELLLPLVVTTEEGRKEVIIHIKERQRDFDIPVDDKPMAVEIDPDYHVFRIVHQEDLNPSLNLFLSRKTRYYVLTEERFRKSFEEITGRLMMTGGEVISGKRLNEYIDKGSIFIVGRPSQGLLNDVLKIRERGFDFKGKAFDGPVYSILLSIRNPYNEKEVIVFYYGNSAEALERARYIPYYGTDTYVIFRDGQPLERGYLDNERSRTKYVFGYIDINRLKGHIGFLADLRQGGRLPGSSGDRNVRDYLMERLKEYGFDAREQVFIISESGLDKKRLKADVTFPVSSAE